MLCFLAVTSALGLNLLLALSRIMLLSDAFRETAAAQAAVPVWMGVLLYGIAAPFSEEVLFRGMFYRKAREAFGGEKRRWAASIFSALLFGIYHGNLVQGIYAFLIGILLCMVYERAGKLSAAVMFHGAGNLAVYLLIDVWGIGEHLPFGVGAALCALLLIAAACCLKPCFGAGEGMKKEC